MKTLTRIAAVASFVMVTSSLVLCAGCSKTDAGSAGASPSAQAAPSASGEGARHEHEHDWDGGHEHGEHPR